MTPSEEKKLLTSAITCDKIDIVRSIHDRTLLKIVKLNRFFNWYLESVDNSIIFDESNPTEPARVFYKKKLKEYQETQSVHNLAKFYLTRNQS